MVLNAEGIDIIIERLMFGDKITDIANAVQLSHNVVRDVFRGLRKEMSDKQRQAAGAVRGMNHPAHQISRMGYKKGKNRIKPTLGHDEKSAAAPPSKPTNDAMVREQAIIEYYEHLLRELNNQLLEERMQRRAEFFDRNAILGHR